MMKRQYIVTERAHFMCPNMHFGIKAKLLTEYDADKFKDTLLKLENAHPFLKSRIAVEEDTGRLYYKRNEELHIFYEEKEDSGLWKGDYQAITKKGWDVFQENLLKVFVYPQKAGFEIIIMAHHLLADGRGLLSLMCEFADCYVKGVSPVYSEERLIRTLQDLPEGSKLSGTNKMILDKANRKWEKEGKKVNYAEYHDFEKAFIHDNPIHITEESLEGDELDTLHSICKAHGVSVNDYLVAEMMHKEQTNRVVIAVDIRRQLGCHVKGALGNYASATGIEVRHRSKSVIETAKKISMQVRKNIGNTKKIMMILSCYLRLTPELIDAAAISTMGEFSSKAGKFIGSMILGYHKRAGFSVTNLGKVDNVNIEELMFIPPASPANRKTMGIVTINRCMNKCTVCYDMAKSNILKHDI